MKKFFVLNSFVSCLPLGLRQRLEWRQVGYAESRDAALASAVIVPAGSLLAGVLLFGLAQTSLVQPNFDQILRTGGTSSLGQSLEADRNRPDRYGPDLTSQNVKIVRSAELEEASNRVENSSLYDSGLRRAVGALMRPIAAFSGLKPDPAPYSPKKAQAPELPGSLDGLEEEVRFELACLAQNVYFEARSEPHSGKLAVAHVVMNRVSSKRFPNKVCDVVRQGGERRNFCQFSWWCDGKSDSPDDLESWMESIKIAKTVYWKQTQDPTGGAMWYHADYVRPYWSKKFIQGAKIGRHIFYYSDSDRPAPQVASNPEQ